MMALGFIAGAIAVGPLCLAIGYFARRDRTVTHESADIGEALRRGSR